MIMYTLASVALAVIFAIALNGFFSFYAVLGIAFASAFFLLLYVDTVARGEQKRERMQG